MITFTLTGKCKQIQIGGDLKNIALIREHFSIANPAYRRNVPYIQPRLYCITPSGKFDIGLFGDILKYVELNRFEYTYDDQIKRLFNPGFKDPVIKTLNLQLRDYQESAILPALSQGRGVTLIPTAGGKTLICATLIESLRHNLNKPNALVLVTVPTLQLVEQTASDFLSYGLTNVTKWSGNNKPDPNATIIVAGTQILLSESTDLSKLSEVEILLMDEVHGLRRGNQLNKVLNFIETPFKFGFTGTMPSTEIDQWNIIGKIGPITYEQKTDDLKKRNFVSNFKVIILNIKHEILPMIQVSSETPALAYQQELEFLMHHERRNDIISNLANKLNQNTLIMVDRIDHGIQIETKLKAICGPERPVYFIRGATEIVEREQIRSFMEDRSDVIIVAVSKIFSTGINIPNLHNIIFASAGKAKIKIMQSIGRALRLHPTKKMATIFDIADNTKYGKIHLSERKKLYNLEKYDYTEKELS
jgi:superfamily II DNA or RNA helicase